MKACTLIKVKPGRHEAVKDEALKLEGVKFAFSVLGRTDVAVSVEVAGIKELCELVLKLGGIKDVAASETLVAMEA
ncbi:MAG: Lrp/AsnC ligand binding domain-containing protein [Candidatus Geothermarchaeales archaeon]